ncbi:MAG: hypothetical protein H0T15_01690 [Thermoleophilaceae bacterium]|nr:hypothetical protein [Thermoleophilaceae bacterium]
MKARTLAVVALIVSILAVTLSQTGLAGALPGASVKPKKFGLLRLNKKKKFPAKVIPTVRRAKIASKLGGKSAADLTLQCNADEVDLGRFCMLAAPYPAANDEIGKTNFFFATQKCVELGGWLPSAGELVGAAERVKLSSTIDDSQLGASVDQDPTDGLKDRREMSSTLVTTAAGSSAAGSQGVTDGSRGDPKQGEQDPAPLAANPVPDTLQYVTVYDNRDKGGFAGSKTVAQSETFRCAFPKIQGKGTADVSRASGR